MASIPEWTSIVELQCTGFTINNPLAVKGRTEKHFKVNETKIRFWCPPCLIFHDLIPTWNITQQQQTSAIAKATTKQTRREAKRALAAGIAVLVSALSVLSFESLIKWQSSSGRSVNSLTHFPRCLPASNVKQHAPISMSHASLIPSVATNVTCVATLPRSDGYIAAPKTTTVFCPSQTLLPQNHRNSTVGSASRPSAVN
jgi:hypothetical protein